MPTARVFLGSPTYWEDLRLALKSIPTTQPLKNKKILVTGGTGMLCSSIVDIFLLLNKEHKTGITIYLAGRDKKTSLDRFQSFSEEDGLVFVSYDATKSNQVDYSGNLDYIIHGASNANPELYMQRPVDTMLANILGLSRMLDLAKASSAKRLLYVSSSEVYGQKPGFDPFSEDDFGYLDILHERAGYPSSKRAGESLCVAYGMQHNIDSVIVRPGHIYGPSIRDSDQRASAQFTRKAMTSEDVVLKSKGTQLRSYCYSLDCASAIITVLLEGERANAYNISNPNSICTISDIAEQIAAAGNVKLAYEDATESGQVVNSLMQNASLVSTKLEQLGWNPAFDLKAGIKSMVETLRESKNPFSL
jgi:nucleoside-diphosphate-sugar epimerase